MKGITIMGFIKEILVLGSLGLILNSCGFM
jgi:hypothetical protein